MNSGADNSKALYNQTVMYYKSPQKHNPSKQPNPGRYDFATSQSYALSNIQVALLQYFQEKNLQIE